MQKQDFIYYEDGYMFTYLIGEWSLGHFTEKQYERLTELQEESADPLSEEVIMDVVNSVEYKQDGWNPYKYRRSMCSIGYYGCNDADWKSVSFKKWKI